MAWIGYFWFKTVFLKGLELVYNKGLKPMQKCPGTNISKNLSAGILHQRISNNISNFVPKKTCPFDRKERVRLTFLTEV